MTQSQAGGNRDVLEARTAEIPSANGVTVCPAGLQLPAGDRRAGGGSWGCRQQGGGGREGVDNPLAASVLRQLQEVPCLVGEQVRKTSLWDWEVGLPETFQSPGSLMDLLTGSPWKMKAGQSLRQNFLNAAPKARKVEDRIGLGRCPLGGRVKDERGAEALAGGGTVTGSGTEAQRVCNWLNIARLVSGGNQLRKSNAALVVPTPGSWQERWHTGTG